MSDIKTTPLDYKSNNSLNVMSSNVSQPNELINISTNNKTASPSTSYVSAVKVVPKITFPKKDQAIVLHAEDSLKLFDYVKAIGDIIGPKNISFASRISNNRICIYLGSTELVDNLVKSHSTIQLQNLILNVRRLISPTKRILISNVSPSIPHEVIENAVKNLGLHLASRVSFLKAGFSDEYIHIQSFRRQIYVFPTSDNFEIQTSILISYDGVDHRIFLSTDKMECFICKQIGHISTTCPNAASINIPVNQPLKEVDSLDLNSSPTSNEQIDFSSTQMTSTSMIPPTNQILIEPCVTDFNLTPSSIQYNSNTQAASQKRNHSETISSCDQLSLPDNICSPTLLPTPELMPPPNDLSDTTRHINRRKKKRKSSEPRLTEVLKKNIEEAYQNLNESFILPIDNFIAFLENTFRSSNPYDEAIKFTKDIKILLSNIYSIYPLLEERSTKNKFTRLYKKLKKQLEAETVESGSNSATPMSTTDLSDEEVLSDTSFISLTPN
ncbi:unnamed protein product [Psylliodes chrysocephalus]|uniref:CCHC-type domain-containing protein n=1 Tax=Psylliodes chrysocephalus TaxID=3402493 RepID=A0A9P0D1Z3_9CUCU|nr:unnamed protein product [Psylliodes chrysocephala]